MIGVVLKSAGLLLKGASKRAVSFVASPLSGYLMVAVGTALIGVFWLWRSALGDLEDARSDLHDKQREADRVDAAYQRCASSLIKAELVAEHNREQAERAMDRAANAAEKARVRWIETQTRIEEIDHEANRLRKLDDGECRTLVDDLPGEFVDWVFEPPSGGD